MCIRDRLGTSRRKARQFSVLCICSVLGSTSVLTRCLVGTDAAPKGFEAARFGTVGPAGHVPPSVLSSSAFSTPCPVLKQAFCPARTKSRGRKRAFGRKSRSRNVLAPYAPATRCPVLT
eukprot:2510773-Rhodomonas_salina.4